MVCIDTSILIDILREDKNTEKLEEYLDRQRLITRDEHFGWV